MIYSLNIVAASDDIYVDSNNGNDANNGLNPNQAKKSISGAINSINESGWTVHLANGVYNGNNNTNLTISQNMTIKGQNSINTIIDGENVNKIFRVNFNTKLSLYNITFKNAYVNRDVDEIGGSVIFNLGSVTIANCNFINNKASHQGGVFSTFDTNVGNITTIVTSFNISKCNFTNNSGQVGGVIFVKLANVTINKCNFDGNVAKGSGTPQGGILFSDRISNVTLIDCKIKNSYATYYGGAIQNYAGLKIINCTFDNVSAGVGTGVGSGGVIYSSVSNTASYDFDGAITTIINSTFTNCKSEYGGVILSALRKLTITNTSFINNSVTGRGEGGAIASSYSTSISLQNQVYIKDCYFEGNSATYRGGAIFTKNAAIQIDNNTFINNTAPTGGAIASRYDLGTIIPPNHVYIKDCYFEGNSATDKGGAISHEIVTMDVYNSEFIKNTASSGGALFNNGTCNIYSSTMINNGLAIAAYNETHINDTTFLNNVVGGVLLNGDFSSITSSTFLSNGYGINVGGSNSRINYNRIYNNTIIGMINTGNNNDANFNWWGVNNATTQVKNTGSGFNMTYWYILQLSLNDNTGLNNFNTTVNTSKNIDTNTNITLSYTLGLNDNNTNNINHDPNLLPYFEVEIIFSTRLRNGTTITLYNKTADIRNTEYSNNFIMDINSYSLNTLSDGENVILQVNSIGPELILTITANATNVSNGDNITYTIIIFNNGTGNATNTIATVLLPDGIIYIVGSNSTNVSYYDPLTRNWYIGNLTPSSSATLNISFTVNKTGIITTNVTASATEENTNVTAHINITAESRVKTPVNKTVNITQVTNGDTITYTILVTNYGPINATGVLAYDKLPSNLIYISSQTAKGYYDSVTGYWYIGNLAIGETASLTITVKVNGVGNIRNVVSLTSNEEDYPFTNEVNIKSQPQVSLNISKVANTTNIRNGDNLSYTITITNNGLNGATGVIASDILPYGVIYISSLANRGYYDPTTGYWYIGFLGAGENVTLKIYVTFNIAGSITNIVSVSCYENNTNIIANTTVISNPFIDFSINKEANTTPIPNGDTYVNVIIAKIANATKLKIGDTIFYKIHVQNIGFNKATGIMVLDNLPKGLIYLKHSTFKGSFDPKTGIWMIGDLEAGEFSDLIIYVKVNKTGKITNYAILSYNEADENITTKVEIESEKIYPPESSPIPPEPTPSNNELINPHKTSGMENTGVPIVAVIVCLIFMIFAIRQKK